MGIGIDESAVLKVDRDVVTVLGEGGVTVLDSSESFKVPAYYFHRKNIKLHYLTSGDVFSLRLKEIITSKPPITTPHEKGFMDSDDILGDGEVKRLVSRLVDQPASSNQGNTQIPRKYPPNTPEFTFLFYKDDHTKGYKVGSTVTAFNVRLDVSAEVRS